MKMKQREHAMIMVAMMTMALIYDDGGCVSDDIVMMAASTPIAPSNTSWPRPTGEGDADDAYVADEDECDCSDACDAENTGSVPMLTRRTASIAIAASLKFAACLASLPTTTTWRIYICCFVFVRPCLQKGRFISEPSECHT